MTKFGRCGVVVLTLTVIALGAAGVAGAQEVDPYVGPSPTVSPEVVDRGVPTEVLSETATAAPAEVQGRTLALTGGDVGALVVIGMVALAAGTALVAARRRAAA